MPDVVRNAPYAPLSASGLHPSHRPFLIERHRPAAFSEPFHHHLSLEMNYLESGGMTYGFGSEEVDVPPGRLILFWGSAPHRVLGLQGAARITNLYLPLGTVLGWQLPGGLSGRLMSGAMLAATASPLDAPWLDRLWAERDLPAPWPKLHLAEIEARLRRAALEPWETLRPGAPADWAGPGRAMAQVEVMLTAVADSYTGATSNAAVTAAAGLSESQGAALFRRVTGQSIKAATTQMRLSHAAALLAGSDAKVATVGLDSGFASQSAFYDAFAREYGVSPAQWRREQRSAGTPQP